MILIPSQVVARMINLPSRDQARSVTEARSVGTNQSIGFPFGLTSRMVAVSDSSI